MDLTQVCYLQREFEVDLDYSLSNTLIKLNKEPRFADRQIYGEMRQEAYLIGYCRMFVINGSSEEELSEYAKALREEWESKHKGNKMLAFGEIY